MKIFALVLLAGVSFAQTVPPPKPADTPQSPEQLLLKADRDFNQAVAQRRLEGWMEYMADNAVLFSAKPVVGKAAIRDFETPAFADPEFQLQWQPTHAEMFPSGDMGYTTGRYELHGKTAKGERVVRHGSYLTVWKKQADGSWKVVADGGAPDKPN
jgi:ketosteroid isomerase-like protein